MSGFACMRSTQTGEVQRVVTREFAAWAVAHNAQWALPACGLPWEAQQGGDEAAPFGRAIPPPRCMVQPGGQGCPSRHCQEAPDMVVIRTKATLRSQANPLRL